MRMVALAAILASLAGFRHDEKACDLKKIEDAPWCPKCKAILEKDGINKDGKCGECGTKPEKVKVCVKTCYKAGC